MTETDYLLSSKANAERLLTSIKEASEGNLISFDPTVSKIEYKIAQEQLYALAFGKETYSVSELEQINVLKNLIDTYQKKHIILPTLTKAEFKKLVKEGENGPLKKLGTFEEFKKDVLFISSKKKKVEK